MLCQPKFSTITIAPLVALAWLLTACHSSPKHYFLLGRVLEKSNSTRQLTVNQNPIPGFMAAMTMPYSVKDTQGFREVQPGDLITADVVRGENNDYWLEHLAIKDTTGRGLLVASRSPHPLQLGERVADIPVTNQDGKALSFGGFRGKAVLITFIYTRCPFPTFCPLISSEFAAIRKEMAKTPADYEKTHLISITLDPQYDTPPIMRKYGLSYLANDPAGFEHWDFVSTSPAELRDLATVFGLEYFEQGNLVPHSMETILLAKDGTVFKYWPGTEWKTSEVISALRQAAAAKEKRTKLKD